MSLKLHEHTFSCDEITACVDEIFNLKKRKCTIKQRR